MPKFDRPSAKPLEFHPISLQAITPSPTGGLRELTRTWSLLSSVSACHPASWSIHLPGLEYSHNSQTLSGTGMSPFMLTDVYQPPLFPSQERGVAVPSKPSLPLCVEVCQGRPQLFSLLVGVWKTQILICSSSECLVPRKPCWNWTT